MRKSYFSICEVEEIIKRRYRITPVSIEPHFNKVLINLTASSSQNRVYTWRFDRAIQDGGSVPNDISFPLFMGSVKVALWNEDSVFTNVAGFFITIYGRIVNSIPNAYVMDLEQWKAFGDGVTFDRPLLPVNFENVTFDKIGDSHEIVAPYMSVTSFVNGTGAFSCQLSLTFSGYKIYLS